jgi:hypothetical protein
MPNVCVKICQMFMSTCAKCLRQDMPNVYVNMCQMSVLRYAKCMCQHISKLLNVINVLWIEHETVLVRVKLPNYQLLAVALHFGISWHKYLAHVDINIWHILTQTFGITWHKHLAHVDINIWHILTQTFSISWHKHLTCVDTAICYILTQAFDMCWHKHLTCVDTSIWHVLTRHSIHVHVFIKSNSGLKPHNNSLKTYMYYGNNLFVKLN